MLQAFVFNEVAVVVRHWYEVRKREEEHGARIEVRRVRRPHKGGPASSQVIELDNGLIWRADLFDLIGGAPGNMRRAHHHIRFSGDRSEPIGRDWDERLSEDPYGWTESRLGDLTAVAAASGVESAGLEADAEDIRHNLPAIMSAVRGCGPERCVSSEQCRRQTRDASEIIDLKLEKLMSRAAMRRADRPGSSG